MKLLGNISDNLDLVTKGYLDTIYARKTSLTDGSVTKVGTSTVGASNRPVYLNAGTPAAVSSVGEAFLSWGGQNFVGSYGCIDAAMIGDLGANRFAFLKAAGIDVLYSRDGGETWVDYGASDAQKSAFFTYSIGFRIGLMGAAQQDDANAHPTNYLLRVIIRTGAAGIYSSLNKFVFYVTTNGSQNCWVNLDVRTETNRVNNVDTWVNRINKGSLSGWSGYNVYNITATTTYGNTPASHYGEWRFTFGCDGYNPSKKADGTWNPYYGLTIQSIFGFGGVGWTVPSNMARNGHLYSFDGHQNATFPNAITAGTLNSYSVIPRTHNSYTLGNTSNRWNNVYSVNLSITGKFTVSGLDVGSSDLVDNAEILTSYAGPSGFATDNTVYRRKASAMYNYIKSKLDSVYLPLSGGTLTGALTTRAITIDSNTLGGADHLVFNRGSYNYIRTSASGSCLAIITGGVGIAASNTDFYIDSNLVSVGNASKSKDTNFAVYGSASTTKDLSVGNTLYVTGKTGFSEGIRIGGVNHIASIWFNTGTDKGSDYPTNSFGITHSKGTGLRFRFGTSASTLSDLVVINETGGITLPADASGYNSKGILFKDLTNRITSDTGGDLCLYAQKVIYLRPNVTSASALSDGVLITDGALYPSVHDKMSLGISDHRWSTIYSKGANVDGNVITKSLYIQGSASSNACISANNALNVFVTVGSNTMLVMDGGSNSVTRGALNTNATLGTNTTPWAAVYATTLYENGTSLASKYVTIGTDQDITGQKKISINKLLFDVDKTSCFTLNGINLIGAAPTKDAWHDHLAFLRYHSINDVQVMNQNGVWSNSDVNVESLFAQKEHESVQILGANDKAFRFTLWSSQYNYCEIRWYIIGVSYNDPFSNVNVVIEASADKSSWLELHNSTIIYQSNTSYCPAADMGGGKQWLRFTFTKTTNLTTGGVSLNSIKGLTRRKGNQGLGKEYELPFSFNGKGTIAPISNQATLGTSTSKWKTLFVQDDIVGYIKALRDPDYHEYAHRRVSANSTFADGALHYYLATSSMSEGKPGSDAAILHMSWDNGYYERQLALITGNGIPHLQLRYENNGTWGSWYNVLDENNYGTYALPRTQTEITVDNTTGWVRIGTIQRANNLRIRVWVRGRGATFNAYFTIYYTDMEGWGYAYNKFIVIPANRTNYLGCSRVRKVAKSGGDAYLEVYLQHSDTSTGAVINVEVDAVSDNSMNKFTLNTTQVAGSIPEGYTAVEKSVDPNNNNGVIETFVTNAWKDSSGNIISSTYLPLSGGTMTGGITMATAVSPYSDNALKFGSTGTSRIGVSDGGIMGIYAGDYLNITVDRNTDATKGITLMKTSLYPRVTNTMHLGTAANRWQTVNSKGLDVDGSATITGGITLSTGSSAFNTNGILFKDNTNTRIGANSGGELALYSTGAVFIRPKYGENSSNGVIINDTVFYPARNNTVALGASGQAWNGVYTNAIRLYSGTITYTRNDSNIVLSMSRTDNTAVASLSYDGWGKLTFDYPAAKPLVFNQSVSVGNYLYVANNKGIYAYDKDGNAKQVLTLSSGNNLILGAEVPALGGVTYIDGTAIRFRTGESRTEALTIEQNLNTYLKGSLIMENGKTIYMKNSDGVAKSLISLSNLNQLYIGYDLATSGYDTRIYGQNVRVYTGTTPVQRLIINANGASFADNLFMANNKSLYFTDTGNVSRGCLWMDANNYLFLGNGTSKQGYPTVIDGYKVFLRYGTGNANGVILHETGNVEIKKTLQIGEATLSWDSTNNALRFDKPIYSDGEVSACGYASSGASGRIIVLEDNGTTTAGTWLAKSGEITSYEDGTIFLYKLTKAGASTTTLNINGLGAKTIYRYGTTKLTTHYVVGDYVTLYYNATAGAFKLLSDYDANSNTTCYQYNRTEASAWDMDLSILTRNATSAVTLNSYTNTYTSFTNNVTINPYTGTLKAKSVVIDGKKITFNANGTVTWENA